MKEIFGEEIDSTDTAKRKRASKRRNGNCTYINFNLTHTYSTYLLWFGEKQFDEFLLKSFSGIDNIIDGSFMGMVLAICLAMVLGAAFFAYKNLYYAVIKKMYPDQHTEL